jgi:hypothetical protein
MGKFQSWVKELSSNPNFSKVGSVLQDFIDGNILVRKSIRKQYLLILMLAAFCIVYIGNRYTCDRAMRQQRELTKEIENLRFELLSVSAELTEKSRGSVVEDSIRVHLPEMEISRVPIIIIE